MEGFIALQAVHLYVMATQTESVVCKKCGAETEAAIAMYETEDTPCEGEPENGLGHDWSASNPLARLAAKVEATDGLAVEGQSDNDTWMWIEVLVDEGRDAVGNSEVLSNYVKREGFDFSGVGSLDNSLRFNKKKQSR